MSYRSKTFRVLYFIIQTRIRLTVHEVTKKQAENKHTTKISRVDSCLRWEVVLSILSKKFLLYRY